MRTKITDNSVKLWLSENDTWLWAHRPGHAWPGSTLCGFRVLAEFDSNGLCDIALDGTADMSGMDVNEFNSICADHLASVLPKTHPAYHVAVGQFNPTPVE